MTGKTRAKQTSHGLLSFLLFQVSQKISKSMTHQALRQVRIRQAARDRQLDPEPKTWGAVGSRAQGLFGASVSRMKRNG